MKLSSFYNNSNIYFKLNVPLNLDSEQYMPSFPIVVVANTSTNLE